MKEKTKFLHKRTRLRSIYELIIQFMIKCNDDHISAFGAMSAFFILLSLVPFMIFLLTLTKYLPFSKNDVFHIVTQILPFEESWALKSIITEIYSKTSTSLFTISILTVLWSSSKGIFSLLKGLNAVFEIEDRRNYFLLRMFSAFYTILLAWVLVAMLVMWVFGNQLFLKICKHFPFMTQIMNMFFARRTIVTTLVLVFVFMLIYYFLPDRVSSFFKQLPGAIVASIGWIIVSRICSIYVDHFSSFTYVYGSMTAIIILLLWLYFCMCMVFYGAEVNYFLENRYKYEYLYKGIFADYDQLIRQKEAEALIELEEMKKEPENHNVLY